MSSGEASSGPDAMPTWCRTILQWRLHNEQGMSDGTATRIRAQLQQHPQQIPDIPLPIQQVCQPSLYHNCSSIRQQTALVSNTTLAYLPVIQQNVHHNSSSSLQQSAFISNTPPTAETVYLQDLHQELNNSLRVVYGDFLDVTNTPLFDQIVTLQEDNQTTAAQLPPLPADIGSETDPPDVNLSWMDNHTEEERRQIDEQIAQYIQHEPIEEEKTEEACVETTE